LNPRVSVIIPCYNEVGTIVFLLESLLNQEIESGEMEIIVSDGMSTDGTRESVAGFARAHPELPTHIVDNADRLIPAALNRAIRKASGDFIIRLDAHSIPERGYVRRCLDVLEETEAANVGGVWDIRAGADRWIGRGIAAAAAHFLGAGDARYRISGVAGPVDTVPFGAFRREWYDRIGPFNESLPTNEDYEFNVRLRQAGGTVWFDPSIRSIYFTRRNLRQLAAQYARYGFWKARMLLAHPASLKWRQALPPLFVSLVILLGVASPFWLLARIGIGLTLAIYVAVTAVAGLIEAARRRDPWLVFGFPLAIWTMHFSWGGAFLWGVLSGLMTGAQSAPGK
jgi:succinoglycan biosynthesis protein ExoA